MPCSSTSYASIISDDKLIIGDQHAARDPLFLEEKKITHIVACGFDRGFFESVRKYRYLCINIPDVPTANLLRYLPKTTSFIENAIQSKNGKGDEGNGEKGPGVVLIHCVHGQSRSCAVAIAYLMRRHITTNIITSKPTTTASSLPLSDNPSSLPHLRYYYDMVKRHRPTIAINPGFLRQLELFRRMLTIMGGDGDVRRDGGLVGVVIPPRSIYHASFRVFRARTEYSESGRVTSRFFPWPLPSSSSSSSFDKCYRCRRCRWGLFAENNIADGWIRDDDAALESILCDFYRVEGYIPGEEEKDTLKANWGMGENVIKLEPMEWMRRDMYIDEDNPYSIRSCGKIACPNCRTKLGSWDWNYINPYYAIFVVASKVE